MYNLTRLIVTNLVNWIPVTEVYVIHSYLDFMIVLNNEKSEIPFRKKNHLIYKYSYDNFVDNSA
jgi:hypothetical protein